MSHLKSLFTAGMIRRAPPALFMPMFGLLGLVLTWKHAARVFSLPTLLIDLATGVVAVLFLFGLVSYATKFIYRSGAVIEDAKTLPGRTGLAAMALCCMLLASVLNDRTPGLASVFLIFAFACLLVLAVFVALQLIRDKDQVGPITPAMHLVFVGFILIPGAALPLGAPIWALEVLCYYCTIAALIVTALTIRPLLTREGPAPLRPLQGIQLAPPALLASSFVITGHTMLATLALIWATGVAVMLALRLPWLIEGGFSGFWSAFTFPVVAFATALMIFGEAFDLGILRGAGGLILILSTLYIPVIAAKILKLWVSGALAEKTNASTA